MFAGRRVFVRHSHPVVLATALFLLVAIVLGWIGADVVSNMRHSANAIDDRRASRAAQTALLSFKQRLTGTVQDNSVWDDAFTAITTGDSKEWAWDNWGKTSEDYPLYDGVVLTAPDGETVSAYLKAQPLAPAAYLGDRFTLQTQSAAHPKQDPKANFYRSGESIVLAASQAVQPFSSEPGEGGYFVLTFLKILTPEVIATVASEYQLEGLTLSDRYSANLLHSPLTGIGGEELAWLTWPSSSPGDQIFSEIRPQLAAAAAILILYVVGVLIAGAVESRRLRRLGTEAHYQATHDSLSGLLNRYGLMEELQHKLPISGAPLTLHLIDLDGFKAVNDAWGHAVGDKLIVEVAEALKAVGQDVGAVARLGGDEFALVQGEMGNPTEFAASIISICSTPFEIEGRVIEIGASVGVASSEGTSDPHELVRRADMALYEAKETGRGQATVFRRDLDLEREKVAALESELRQALHDEAIEPVFQPLVSATTGEIRGVEALARWVARSGRIAPDIFIPLAEKCGLIDALGLQMLLKSVNVMRAWADLGLSVNVSPLQLCNPNFAADVLRVLREEGFDPARLTLEITEGVLMSNPEQARRSIDALKATGIGFALDDFGCGHASIGTLREFGFDRMKIDRSLVAAADDGGRGLSVLKATIALANALGIPVTAEGIEFHHQADVLRAAGCDQLQGFILGRPMSAKDLAQRLAANVFAA